MAISDQVIDSILNRPGVLIDPRSLASDNCLCIRCGGLWTNSHRPAVCYCRSRGSKKYRGYLHYSLLEADIVTDIPVITAPSGFFKAEPHLSASQKKGRLGYITNLNSSLGREKADPQDTHNSAQDEVNKKLNQHQERGCVSQAYLSFPLHCCSLPSLAEADEIPVQPQKGRKSQSARTYSLPG